MFKIKSISILIISSILFVSCDLIDRKTGNKVSKIELEGTIEKTVKAGQSVNDTIEVKNEFAEAAWFSKEKSTWLKTTLIKEGKKIVITGKAPNKVGDYQFDLHVRSGAGDFSHHRGEPYDITWIFDIAVK
ncbi:MAG TPA: hypothetical protein VLA13_08045 [Massilibacterium sp.]|nr:hypothetical protein [Massilibacterium sp.]